MMKRERAPFVEKLIKKGLINSCFCIEGNCALHIKNEISFKSINFGLDKKCLKLSLIDNKIYKDNF